jgi:hypothetical protein
MEFMITAQDRQRVLRLDGSISEEEEEQDEDEEEKKLLLRESLLLGVARDERCFSSLVNRRSKLHESYTLRDNNYVHSLLCIVFSF